MIRLLASRAPLFLLLLLFAVRAHADPVTPAAPFDQQVAASVYATALSFLAPRTLEAVPVSRMAVWGLRGLTAVDPRLIAEPRGDDMTLSLRGRLLRAVPAPLDDDPNRWADLAAQLAAAAVEASPLARQSGTAGIVQGFFDELFNHLDPYSRYVAPADAGDDLAQRRGQGGLGLTLARRGGAVVIAAAVDDGPGALAGMRVGDRILSVDGESVGAHPAAWVADRIEGPEDTPVNVAWRGRDGRVRRADFTRALVPPETVVLARDGTALVLRVSGFNRTTGLHLARALVAGLAQATEPEGIVLDLRGNRGGLLTQAVAAAEALLPPGVVAITAGRDPAANRVFRTEAGDISHGLPVVVLIDGRSASAAEILAASLVDRGRAVAVGSVSFGKGLVQTIAPLPDGGELFVTWSRVLAPLGWPIQGLGVMPQVCTSLGQDALDRALDDLDQGRPPMGDALALHNAARAPVPAAQVVAIRDRCPAAEGRDADLDVAKALIEDPAAYATALLPPLR